MMLSPEAFTHAREYLRTQGRHLDQAIYCFHFGCTTPIDARVALGAFQNPDGGFGHYPGRHSDMDAVYFQFGTLIQAGRIPGRYR